MLLVNSEDSVTVLLFFNPSSETDVGVVWVERTKGLAVKFSDFLRTGGYVVSCKHAVHATRYKCHQAIQISVSKLIRSI